MGEAHMGFPERLDVIFNWAEPKSFPIGQLSDPENVQDRATLNKLMNPFQGKLNNEIRKQKPFHETET